MNVSKVQARKLVLVSAFLLAAIAIYRDRTQGAGDTFRALWGVGVLSFLLSLVADFAPQIAGPFAALTVLGSMTSGGDRLIQSALGKAGAAPAGKTNTPAGAADLTGVTSVVPRQTRAGGPQ